MTQVTQRQEYSGGGAKNIAYDTNSQVCLYQDYAIKYGTTFLIGQVIRMKHNGKDFKRPVDVRQHVILTINNNTDTFHLDRADQETLENIIQPQPLPANPDPQEAPHPQQNQADDGRRVLLVEATDNTEAGIRRSRRTRRVIVHQCD